MICVIAQQKKKQTKKQTNKQQQGLEMSALR